MSLRVKSYKIVRRKFFDHFFLKSFDQFKDCCGECWCCVWRNAILNEFEKKGFNTFNSEVEGWKRVAELNKFEIITLGIETARG